VRPAQPTASDPRDLSTPQRSACGEGESRQAFLIVKPGLKPLTRFRLKGLLINSTATRFFESGKQEKMPSFLIS
jgi:hypothetical protein